LDPDGQGVNILLHPAAGPEAKITCSMSNQSIAAVLDATARMAGVTLRFESYAATLRPD
jgi:hypothetical protein